VRCIDATTADCQIFIYKEGLLSSIGHDLKLAVTRFALEIDPERLAVKAEFDSASLRVSSAMKDGQEAPHLLNAADRRNIEHTIATEVLAAGSYPQILFASTEIIAAGGGSSFDIKGRLTLHGRTRELRCSANATSDRLLTEVVLHQPDYGIRPYSALLGTLRIRQNITVHLSLPRW
jgi:polyisoprenoid-binding protein YceI